MGHISGASFFSEVAFVGGKGGVPHSEGKGKLFTKVRAEP